MMKKLLCALLCALLICNGVSFAATHEVLEGLSVANGQVGAVEFVDLVAPCSGVLAPFDIVPGDAVAEGDVLFSMVTANVTASERGTVTWVFAGEGERADSAMARYGAVLSMEPAQDKRIMASTDGAYNEEENRIVHVGEIVYFQSTKGDKEEGAGRVISVSGANFVVDILTGEFETGEALSIYRDDDYDAKEKIGKGSVSRRDPLSVMGTGVIAQMMAEEGKTVEAGETLFTLMGADADMGAKPDIAAPYAGVVGNVAVASGQQVWKGQLLARVFCEGEKEIVAQVDEVYLKNVNVGDKLYVTLDTDEEAVLTGTVTEISALGTTMANAAYYTVRLSVSGADEMMLGQSAKVYLPK